MSQIVEAAQMLDGESRHCVLDEIGMLFDDAANHRHVGMGEVSGCQHEYQRAAAVALARVAARFETS